MSITSTLPSIVFPVSDLDAAKKVFTTLFGEPHTDSPYYVGYAVGELQIGLNPNGHAGGMTDGAVYWAVSDISQAVADLTAAGATVKQAPAEVGGGTTIGTLSDPDGNTVGLIQGPQGS